MAPVKGPRRLRVLVVDDDARVRSALRHLLDDVGELRCLAVDTGQAVRLLTWGSNVSDVAVVDLPSGSPAASPAGCALVERLAGLVPVVVVSMSGSRRSDALAAGAHSFVEKDGDGGALLAAIRSAVDAGRRPLAGEDGTRQNAAVDDQHAAPPVRGGR
ncbi:MAG: response regulator transcription factor [Micrococcales bacterium]|nr:response regulator transcription factor [Micrococcales bacterium]